MRWIESERRKSSLKLLVGIALGVGVTVLAAAAFLILAPLFDAVDYPAPSGLAPDSAARSAGQSLAQNPTDYGEAALTAERPNLESERARIYAEIDARE